MTVPIFKNINRMFVLSVKNGDDKRKILDIFLNKILLELAD